MGKDSSRRQDGWSWKIRLVGTVLSLILLVWLLSRQEWSAIFDAFGTLSIWQVVASVLLIGVRHAFHTLRWWLLVRAQEIELSFAEMFKLVFSGLFVSNFLPSMVGGDVVKIAGVIQKTEQKVAGTASVVVDRLLGATAMLFALPFSVPLIGSFFKNGAVLGSLFAGLTSGFSKSVRTAIDRLTSSVKLWASQPRYLGMALICSWSGMLVNFLAIWLLAQGLGISVSLGEVVGASALTYYLTLIPLSINGFGVRELAIVGLYTQIGSTTEQASALALVTRFVFMVVSLLGVIWVGKVLANSQHRQMDGAEGSSQ